MACGVCGEETSEPHSKEPAGDSTGYVSITFEDEEVADEAIPATTYEFCSLDHARAFVPDDDPLYAGLRSEDTSLLEHLHGMHHSGIEANLNVHTDPETRRVAGRSWYYDGAGRLLLTESRPVDPEEVAEDEPPDDVDYVLKQTETFYEVEEVEGGGYDAERDMSLAGEHAFDGWHASRVASGATTYMPVNETGEVKRSAGNQPVAVFLTYQHYNLQEDVFDEGGLWEAVLDGPEDA